MIELYKPRREELLFRQQLLSDEETMAYNHAWGGVVSFPEEDWDSWYDWWVAEPGDKRFYRYLKDEEYGFVGETAYHFDRELSGFIANVIVHARYRGRGFGSQALDLLCAAAGENGLEWLFDDIAADNPAVGMFLRHGFIEESRTEEKIILKKRL